MKLYSYALAFFVGSGALFPGVPAGALEITLMPVADTSLWERDPDYNFGGQTDIPAGTIGPRESSLRSRALFRFDLTALPANAVIQFAALELFVVKSPENPENSTFGLHRVLKDWGEGDKQDFNPGGAPATEGESNWVFSKSPDEFWGVPGGMVGEDYVAEASSTERIFGNGSYIFEFGSISVANDLQFWLQNPEQNFGWILISDMEERGLTARRIGSRENVSSSPLLTIEYILDSSQPIPPVIRGIRLDGSGVIITFSAEPGVAYTLQTKELIGEDVWLDSMVLQPVEIVEELSATFSPGDELTRFFRVKAELVPAQ